MVPKMLNLLELLNLISDEQDVRICYDGYVVKGTADTLRCVLCEDMYKGVVTDVSAGENMLNILAEEDEQHNESTL